MSASADIRNSLSASSWTLPASGSVPTPSMPPHRPHPFRLPDRDPGLRSRLHRPDQPALRPARPPPGLPTRSRLQTRTPRRPGHPSRRPPHRRLSGLPCNAHSSRTRHHRPRRQSRARDRRRPAAHEAHRRPRAVLPPPQAVRRRTGHDPAAMPSRRPLAIGGLPPLQPSPPHSPTAAHGGGPHQPKGHRRTHRGQTHHPRPSGRTSAVLPKNELPRICQKPTITVRPGDLGKIDKFRQDRHYLHPAWQDAYRPGRPNHSRRTHLTPRHHNAGPRTPNSSPSAYSAPKPPPNPTPTSAELPPQHPPTFGQHLEKTPETPRSRPINQIRRDLVNHSRTNSRTVVRWT
ncbi:hypothetical protein J2Z30_003426 [Streptomyces iranensis]|uniref:Uncharacterized protein n=1 Tax=Streptomyces iranensis TaxID=576784 RepID=A0ABS4MRS1_9ACTN|nr:hypothetical protein [Streptomyces iranensis]